MARQVFLIPGLGADGRQFVGPWDELAGAVRVTWPVYHGEASIPSVARHAADAWGVDDGAILIATSFGGTVACEICRIRNIRQLYLIASGSNASHFLTTERARRTARVTWLGGLQMFFKMTRPMREWIWGRRATPFDRGVLTSIDMFSDCQPRFYRQMFTAMSRWDGFADDKQEMYRVHGREDTLAGQPTDVDLLLDGGHLLPFTHARQCVDFIQQHLPADVDMNATGAADG